MTGNRIFHPSGDGWPGFPKRAFARLDQTEPIDPRESGEAVFAFDSIDANWLGFGAGGDFDLAEPERGSERFAEFWNKISYKAWIPQDATPYDPLPIYRIEITAKRDGPFWETLVGFTEEDWITLELTGTGSFPVDVYGAILAAAPVKAFLLSVAHTALSERRALDKKFIDLWPDASDAAIDSALSGGGAAESLVAYDVGQGTALGLLDSNETAGLYFDLGAGAYGNVKTRPAQLRFCWRGTAPPVVLSHWDTDHWAGELQDPLASQQTWIAPRQPNLGFSHHAFAAKIAAAGKLLIWNAAAGTQRSFPRGSQTLTLARCTGTGKNNRNGSGIAALVTSRSGEAWVLTGDAGYHELGLALPHQLSAVVVPHHGADMGQRSIPPQRPNNYARLIYSFGPDNTHGKTQVTHPTSAAVNVHANRGWQHGTWSSANPAQTVAGADVLATAQNGLGQTAGHLDSAAGGWTRAPRVPFNTVPCAKSSAVNAGCTSNVVQS